MKVLRFLLLLLWPILLFRSIGHLANVPKKYFGPIVNGFWLVKCIVMMMKVPKTKSLLLLLRCQRANLFHEILCMFPNLNLIAKLVGEKTAFLKVITLLEFQAVRSKNKQRLIFMISCVCIQKLHAWVSSTCIVRVDSFFGTCICIIIFHNICKHSLMTA